MVTVQYQRHLRGVVFVAPEARSAVCALVAEMERVPTPPVAVRASTSAPSTSDTTLQTTVALVRSMSSPARSTMSSSVHLQVVPSVRSKLTSRRRPPTEAEASRTRSANPLTGAS